MCTVTAVFYKKEFILTSNRDIQIDRAHSLPPSIISYNDVDIISPIDPTGGGTWIGASSKYVACLLNNLGKEKKDVESRGLLVNKILSGRISLDELFNSTQKYNPYVLLAFDRRERNFWKISWDGSNYKKELLKIKNRIWLSTTIYSEDDKLKKRDLFSNFNSSYNSKEDILDFHTRKCNLIKDNIKTTSVTQIHEASSIELNHRDLIEDKDYRLKFSK